MRGACEGGWRLAVAVGIFAALLALPGCITVRSDSPPSWLPKSMLPTATQQPAPQPASHPAPAQKGTLASYLVKNNRVVRVARDGKVSSTSAVQALAVLLAGPSGGEKAAGLGSAIPAGTEVRDAAPDFEGNVRVDLTRQFAAGGSGASMKLRLAQVVAAVSQLPNVKGVLIKIEGKSAPRFGREGYDLMRPLRRADFADVLPAE